MLALAHILVLLSLVATAESQHTLQANCSSIEAPGQEIVEFKKDIKTHRLAGIVASPSGPLIPGVTVELLDPRERCAKATTTDANGKFDFRISNPGRYKLRLSRAGFNTVIAVARVSPKAKGLIKLDLPMSN